MKKRILSLTLCLCMVLTLLPTAVLAADRASTQIQIGSVTVSAATEPTYWTVKNGALAAGSEADYQVSYDPSTGIVTLNGANLTQSVDVEFNGAFYRCAIAAIGPLQLNLIGENSVTSANIVGLPGGKDRKSDLFSTAICTTGNITITGSGSLTATGGNVDKDQTMADDDIGYAFSYGIYTGGAMTVEDATVHAVGGHVSAWMRIESAALFMGGKLTMTNATLTAIGGTAVNYRTDVKGEAVSKGLSAYHGAEIIDSVVYAKGGDTTASNNSGGSDSIGLDFMEGNVTLTGSDVTAIGHQAAGASYGVHQSNGSMTISDSVLSATAGASGNGQPSDGLYVKESASNPTYLNHGILIASSSGGNAIDAAITTSSEMSYTCKTAADGELAPYTGAVSGTYAEIWGMEPLSVGGVPVTSENTEDILGDGTASYAADTNTLTLTNAAITGARACIGGWYLDNGFARRTLLRAGILTGGDLNLAVVGDCSVTPDTTGQSNLLSVRDISVGGALTVDETNGSLTAIAESSVGRAMTICKPVTVASGETLDYSAAKSIAMGKNGSLTVAGSLLLNSAFDTVEKIAALNLAGNGTVTAGGKTYVNAAGEWALRGADVSTTGLDLSGTRPTDQTAYAAGQGYLIYTPGQNGAADTLTLTNATINSGSHAAIVLPTGTVNLVLKGANVLTSKDPIQTSNGRRACIMGAADLIISAEGNATLDLEAYDSGIEANTVTVNSGALTIVAPTNGEGAGLHVPDGAVTLSGGTVRIIVPDNGSARSVVTNSFTMEHSASLVSNGGLSVSGATSVLEESSLHCPVLVLSITPTIAATAHVSVLTMFVTMEASAASLLMNTYGDAEADEFVAYILSNLRSASATSVLSVPAGTTLTLPAGLTIDLSTLESLNGIKGGFVNNGRLCLPVSTTPAQIRALNLSGSGVVLLVSTWGEDGEPTSFEAYDNDGTKLTVRYDNLNLTDSDTPASGDGYEWNSEEKTLTLRGAYLAGGLTVPTETILQTTAPSYVSQIDGNGQNASLTIAAGADVTVENGISLCTSGGVNGKLTVNGSLTVSNRLTTAITVGQAEIGSAGRLSLSGSIGLRLGGANPEGSGTSYDNALVIRTGGTLSGSCTDSNVMVYFPNYETLPDSAADVLVLPENYLPSGWSVQAVAGEFSDHAYTIAPVGAELMLEAESVTGAGGTLNLPKQETPSIGISAYTLSFETNGGSVIASVSKSGGTTVDLAAYQPTRTGYTFAGWYADAALTTVVNSVKLTKNTTVYAKWAAGTSFADVKEDAYYADAVEWAKEQGITGGVSATVFAPNAACTRAQTVTFLWRAMGCPEPTSTKNPFTDVKADAYYYKAILWAVEQGIAKGITATTFAPTAIVTRAQAVTFQWRAAGAKPATAKNPFTDVAAYAYYADAVLWAVGEEITEGTTATTFSPTNPCTRAQIVTFLYRQLGR